MRSFDGIQVASYYISLNTAYLEVLDLLTGQGAGACKLTLTKTFKKNLGTLLLGSHFFTNES